MRTVRRLLLPTTRECGEGAAPGIESDGRRVVADGASTRQRLSEEQLGLARIDAGKLVRRVAARHRVRVDVCSRVEHRVTRELLQAELTELGGQSPRGPCRVVVSGPAGFNGAVREMLVQCGVDMEMCTILSA